MTQESLDEIIRSLNEFIEKLKNYKTLVRHWTGGETISSPDDDFKLLSGWTDQLTKEAARLKPLVEETAGVPLVRQFGTSWDPWAEAFERQYNSPYIITSIDVVVQNTLQAVGYIEGKEIRDALQRIVQPKSIDRPKVC